MYRALQKYGFGKSCLGSVKTSMYNEITSIILNNGWISAPHQISCGIRQGCLLSALILVIAVEMLATSIRNEKIITGLEMKLNKDTHIASKLYSLQTT